MKISQQLAIVAQNLRGSIPVARDLTIADYEDIIAEHLKELDELVIELESEESGTPNNDWVKSFDGMAKEEIKD
jgi:hypothetical protein